MGNYLLINPDNTCINLSITAEDMGLDQIKAAYANQDQFVVKVKKKDMPINIPIEAWLWDDATSTIKTDETKIPPNYTQALSGLDQLLPAEKLGMGIDYLLLLSALQLNDQALALQVKIRITTAMYEASDKVEAIMLAAGFPPPY